jgi:hypothetical protein
VGLKKLAIFLALLAVLPNPRPLPRCELLNIMIERRPIARSTRLEKFKNRRRALASLILAFDA